MTAPDSAGRRAREVHGVLTAAMSAVAAANPGGRLVTQGQVRAILTGATLAFLNPIHVWEGSEDLERDLEEVIARAHAAGVPFEVVAPEGASHTATVRAVAERQGLEPARHASPGMALHALPDLPPAPAGDLTVREVTDEAGLHAQVDLVASSFGLPRDVTRMICEPVLERRDFRAVVLYRAGEAVATSTVVLVGDVAGVFNVAVPEPHRRRGLGEAATWEAVRRGVGAGARSAVLEASVLGFGLYHRMGFRVVTEMRAFGTPTTADADHTARAR